MLFNVPMAILHPLAPLAQLIDAVRRDDDDSASTIPTIFRARVRRRRFFENCADVFLRIAPTFFFPLESDDDDFPRSSPEFRKTQPNPTRGRRLRDLAPRKELNTPAASA